MQENNDKILMRAIDVKKFNEDMKLIEEFTSLMRKTFKKVTLEKDFYMDEIYECSRIANHIHGYANIIQKKDLECARKYLRTGLANGSTIYLDNISQELQSILDNDKYWNEEIAKNQVQHMFSDEDKENISSELTELWNDDNFWEKETK